MNVRNHIHLTGNLGSAPKTTTLKNGSQATEFSLATNEYFRDKDGKRQTRTQWHRVKAYGKLAELFDQYLERGSQVAIVGSMQYRRWVDKHEQVRTTAEVIAEEFTFLGAGKRGSAAAESSLVADPETGEVIAPKTQKRRSKNTAADELAA
ncbi:single-stranded DNA-binding protein [Neolewinella lacunae]|uniref:Single-stranded DNA-binding protein n=1 Tax=Neolewinella lacunae TaxID=1517758 RepID=A0A923T9E0_9BACT|nr:single-stranded DNA-binding protein [Neolewinella lacunae]MBC6994963.1 single-stranded DNA-binding protein [Neolewinella lacunae]MDN3633266.1 single-stranded DNA-binding protein [Neolewinella lacunae]